MSRSHAHSETAILAATIGGSAMAFIDGSVVQIALPAIQADLGADFTTLQWIVNIYVLFIGALVLVGGAYGDSLGRRRVFAAGTAVFVLASGLCGLAPGALWLVAARALQGIGSALMIPQSLAIIAAAFPEDRRGRAIGSWAAASALTTALGPTLGGVLVDLFSWRAAFLINLPVGAVVLWLTATRVPESRAPDAAAVDLVGGILVTIGLGALTVGLVHLADRGLGSGLVQAGFAVALVALPGFVWWERRIKAPMMPLGLFRDRSFAGVNILTVLLYAALSGALFIVPYTLIGLRGYTAAEAGLALLPMGLAIGLLSRVFGALGDRIGGRLPMVVGSAIVAASAAWLGQTGAAGSYWLAVFGPILGIGFGMAIVIAPLTTTVMNAVDDAHSGAASGINNAAARVAGLLAVAITGAVLAVQFGAALKGELAGIDGAAAVLAQADRLLDTPIPPGPAAERIRRAFAASYEVAFRWGIGLNVMLAALAAVVGLVMLPAGGTSSNRK
jgi:EmrB/QacA subfamily drug resistance transporter